MIKTYEGTYAGKGLKIGIIMSRFNDFIGNQLLEGAVSELQRHGVNETDITIIKVPGAFEIPGTLSLVIKQNRFQGVVCLGVLIRGNTPHFDYSASEVTKGIGNCSLTSKIPITYGVLTCDTIEQAIERAGTKAGNKGADAARTLVEMINLYTALEG
jgi:6,7-dimethyl-8-ribityllumazine synthase